MSKTSGDEGELLMWLQLLLENFDFGGEVVAGMADRDTMEEVVEGVLISRVVIVASPKETDENIAVDHEFSEETHSGVDFSDNGELLVDRQVQGAQIPVVDVVLERDSEDDLVVGL